LQDFYFARRVVGHFPRHARSLSHAVERFARRRKLEAHLAYIPDPVGDKHIPASLRDGIKYNRLRAVALLVGHCREFGFEIRHNIKHISARAC
jgi:hypothetical protein